MTGKTEVKGKSDEEIKKNAEAVLTKIFEEGVLPKDAMGLSEEIVEGIYAHGYRLYNSGNYKDAAAVFRLLIALNPTEGKYTMGLAACFHMLKDYATAAMTYQMCGFIQPDNPFPHYHASDCYYQMGDKHSAMLALEMAAMVGGSNPKYAVITDRARMSIESLKKEIAAQEAENKR